VTSSLKRLFRPCPVSLAFPATVALGYFSGFWQGAIDLGTHRGRLCLALGVLYSVLGAIDFIFLRDHLGGKATALYLLVQGCLLIAVLATSRVSAEMFFCALPLAVALVTLLAPAAALSWVAILYAMTVAASGHYRGMGSVAPFALSTLPAFGFVVIFTRIAMREQSARARAESLSAEVEKLAVIQERNRLAREIHDSLGHYLTTIHVQLEAARAIHATEPARALEAVGKAQDLARDALVEVRRSVGALRADWDPAPLGARMGELAASADGWGTAVSMEVLGEPRILAPAVEHALFRSTQEGLTNVRKHAKARSAQVVLDYTDPGRVCVCVTDDGRGAAGQSAGIGLAGIRERIGALEGRVAAETQPGGGFRLKVEIPA